MLCVNFIWFGCKDGAIIGFHKGRESYILIIVHVGREWKKQEHTVGEQLPCTGWNEHHYLYCTNLFWLICLNNYSTLTDTCYIHTKEPRTEWVEDTACLVFILHQSLIVIRMIAALLQTCIMRKIGNTSTPNLDYIQISFESNMMMQF